MAKLPTDMVLTDAEVIALELPHDLAGAGVCHTQGLAFDGEDIVVSCVVYDPERPDEQSSRSSALILRGAAHGPERSWLVSEITAPVSADISRRITRQELERDQLTAAEDEIVRVLSHPSGLVHDALRGGVWVANAVYSAESHTRLILLGDHNQTLRSIELPNEHVGAIALLRERFIVGWTWDSKHVVVVDLEDAGARPVTVPNPLLDTEQLVAIQDCYPWDDDHILCSGMYKYTTGEGADEIRHRLGRLQLLRVELSRLPRVDVHHVGYVTADFGAGPTAQLGARRYRIDDDDVEVQLQENDYGGYRTPSELTHEGMTLSLDRQHVYFVPDDLPEGKMLRMALRPAAQ